MARLVAAGGPRGPDIDPRVSTWRPGADAVILAIPLVVPLGMRALFGGLTRRLGARRGYLAGFGCYWAGCYLLPPALLGRRRVQALLRQPAGPLPRPRWLAAMALLVPPLGAAGMSVRPSRQPGAFLAGSALIGAGLGWIAWRTRSLRWTLPAHLATDANGLSAARFWLGRPD